ncbi:hypothetical protein ACHAW6_003139 [Cyclotella cf. meneghiniana]
MNSHPSYAATVAKIELTPPDIHQHNHVECTIQTFKGHFIAILSNVDNLFPINKWDSLLLQAVLTLNLLQNSNIVPKTSIYAYHCVPFNYDRMPLAPLGCAVQFHIKPSHCCTLGEKSINL